MSKKLKIRSHGVLGTHHSWAVTMRSLIDPWASQGHDLCLVSTNGYKEVPKDWGKFFILNKRRTKGIPGEWLGLPKRKDVKKPDIDICYTLPRNFKARYAPGAKLKLGIYNYETSKLPAEWVSEVSRVDLLLPSSNFSKWVFVNSGVDPDKCVVVPHGINPKDFEDERTVLLGNKKKFRFLNVSIPHYRKNVNILLEAYYTAFSANDDVCLVLKTDFKAPKGRKRFAFEVDISKEIHAIQLHYSKLGKDLPQVEVIQQRFDSMVPLYNSCDCLVSAASSEGFGLPLLEGLAADMLVVSPRCTGQLDFLNDDNSLLYPVKEIEAPDRYQYWRPTPGATTFMPHKNDLAGAMRDAYENRDALKTKFDKGRLETIEEFTWENAANKILELL